MLAKYYHVETNIYPALIRIIKFQLIPLITSPQYRPKKSLVYAITNIHVFFKTFYKNNFHYERNLFSFLHEIQFNHYNCAPVFDE